MSNRRRLVIHFDVNETILVGDEAGGDTKEDCLNKIIAKNAFVRIPKTTYDGDSDEAITTTIDPNNNNGRPKNSKILSKITPIEWWDGTLIQSSQPPPPPPHTAWEWIPNSCPYYRTSFKKKSKTFINHDGRGYRALYEKLTTALNINDNKNYPNGINTNVIVDERLSKDGGRTHFLIPAFFRTLANLASKTNPTSEDDVSIVIRTFGSDVIDVADAISAFATGHHPDYPSFKNPKWMLTRDSMFRARWNRDKHIYELHRWTEGVEDHNKECLESTTLVASGDEEILNIIENLPICAIQDDYQFWSLNDCQPYAGKPLWVRSPLLPCAEETPYHHHIIFDDNIKNDPDDSIVGVRWQGPVPNTWLLSSPSEESEGCDDNSSSSSFRSLSGEDICQLQGKYLVRVPTMEPILNLDWFLDKIQECERNVASAVDS